MLECTGALQHLQHSRLCSTRSFTFFALWILRSPHWPCSRSRPCCCSSFAERPDRIYVLFLMARDGGSGEFALYWGLSSKDLVPRRDRQRVKDALCGRVNKAA